MKGATKGMLIPLLLFIISIENVYSQGINKDRGKSLYTTEEVIQMCGVPMDTLKMNQALARQDSMYSEYIKSIQSTKSKLSKVASVPNWRGIMSDVENQGSCGDCWVHAATGITEGQISILYGSRLNVDLDELEISGACGGGWPTQAENIIETNKIKSEAGPSPNLQGVRWGIASYSSTSGITAIKNALTNGPVAACFSVYQDFVDFFNDPVNKTGVYHHSYGTQLANHAVVIVSYDDNSSSWLCKNSWGTAWADAGYFRIGYGQCLIESMENSVVTVNQSCYGKIIPDLVPSLLSYGFVNNEWAYVYDNESVNSGQTLTIPAGGEIVFQSGRTLTINGTITCSGNASQHVVFTGLGSSA